LLPPRVVVSFVIVVLVILVTGGLRVANVRTVYVTREAVARSYIVKDALQELLLALVDAETGERGFLITGDAAYLQPYNGARLAVDKDLARLREVTGNDPEAQRDLADVTRLSRQKLDELTRAITELRDHGFAAAQAIVRTNRGKQTMDEARAVVARFDAREDARLAQRTARAADSYRLAQLAGLAASAVALFAVMILFVVTRRLGTERRQATELAERLRVTLASIGDGVIATDEDGRVILINEVAEQLTGWTTGDAIGRHLQEVFVIINEQTRAPAENPVTRVLRERIVLGLANHTVLIARDGREVPVDDCAAPIQTEGGRFVGAIMVFRDVTERRRIERQHDELLEREEAARMAADAANRAKDQFLATISHELRTPLNGILGWADLLRRGILPDERRQRAIDAIYTSGRRQQQLISELLDISRITSGKLQLDRSVLDLPKLVRAAVDVTRAAAEAKHIALALDIDDRIAAFYGDPTRLQQIVWNLLSNAIKFTPEGGDVRVSVEHGESGIDLIVSDSGQGIPEEFLPRLFEPFQQADASTTRRHEGLGLGLAIVRTLTEAHGGAVRAESAGLGRGSMFHVHLPVSTVSEAALHNTGGALGDPPAALSPTALHGVSVLIVEDDDVSRQLLIAALEAHGAHVIAVGSAGDALRALTTGRVNAVISDIAMPDEDGYVFIRKIRGHAVPAIRTVPAIALTSLAREEERQQALDAGFDAHVAKPIEVQGLIGLLGNLAQQVERS
jgi:PAS domain S-box-containing protein